MQTRKTFHAGAMYFERDWQAYYVKNILTNINKELFKEKIYVLR